MRTRPQNIPGVIAVTVLAIVLTWAIAGQATAHSAFQSPLEPIATETGTSASAPTDPGIAPPNNFDASPALAATPALPIAATPTVPGFLPAPTLVNPNDLVQGRPALSQPGGAPLVGPAQAPQATATPAAQPVPDAAQLIDNAIVALGYFWLCCGALFVAVLALGAVWLARRSRRR